MRFFRTIAAILVMTAEPWMAQTLTLKNGNFITPGDLPPQFSAALKRMGGRLMNANQATTTISGTLTEGTQTRTVQITIQAPGLLRFQDNNSHTITYDGTKWQVKNSSSAQDDSRIEESLLAHQPDALLLEMASGGGFRQVGSHFRTDDGKTPNYSGPFWTLYEYAPPTRPGLAMGQALAQGFLVALDEQTGFPSEVRIIRGSGSSQQVTQTKFNNWVQQAGQWFPGEIARKENGQQVLTLTVQQVASGGAVPASAFQP